MDQNIIMFGIINRKSCWNHPTAFFITKKMTLKETQEIVDSWIKKHGVRYFNELTNTAILISAFDSWAAYSLQSREDLAFRTSEGDGACATAGLKEPS